MPKKSTVHDALARIDYPRKELVLIGPDGGAANSEFNPRTHHEDTYTFPDTARSVSGAFMPAYNASSLRTRHAPHPFRVRHIEGLNGLPICDVFDDLPVSQREPKYFNSVSTPERAKTYFTGRVPVDQMEIALRLKNPRDVFYRPKTLRAKVPGQGFIAAIPDWHHELSLLTQRSLGEKQERREHPTYSRHAGRLNESRSVNKHQPNQRPMAFKPPVVLPDIRSEQVDVRADLGMESEALVMELLSQLLKTDSITAIQTWLCNATEQEKNFVADLVRQTIDKELQTKRS